MNHLKRLTFSFALTFVFGVTAFAGITETPPCAPGELSSPPCAINDVTVTPGETSALPTQPVVTVTDIAETVLWSLLLF